MSGRHIFLPLIAFLLIAPATLAGQSSETGQGLTTQVLSRVSWGSADGCVQNIHTNDFAHLTPSSVSSRFEPFDASPHNSASIDSHHDYVWVGCVTTNTELGSVTASGLHDMTSAGRTLPLANVDIGLTNSAGGELHDGQAGCVVQGGQHTAGACPLPVGGAQPTLVTGASPGTTELDWQYQLDLPANQPGGTYIGGEAIFTATAGDPSPIERGPGNACDATWTGAVGDGRWDSPGNWQSASTPGPADHVCIPSWLLQKVVPSGGFKTMPACPRTSLHVIGIRSCCCRRT